MHPAVVMVKTTKAPGKETGHNKDAAIPATNGNASRNIGARDTALKKNDAPPACTRF